MDTGDKLIIVADKVSVTVPDKSSAMAMAVLKDDCSIRSSTCTDRLRSASPQGLNRGSLAEASGLTTEKTSISCNKSIMPKISDSKPTHCPKYLFLSLFLFILFWQSLTVDGADLRPRPQASPTKGDAQKKTSTQDSHEFPKQQSPPDWVPDMTPPSSSYYADEGLYMDMADGAYQGHGHMGEPDDMLNTEEFYPDGRAHRDRAISGRRSTFLISLIVVVSVVAGCGATIVVLGYYCQLCC